MSAELVVEVMGDPALTGEADAEIHEMLLTRCLSIAGGTTQILRNVIAETAPRPASLSAATPVRNCPSPREVSDGLGRFH